MHYSSTRERISPKLNFGSKNEAFVREIWQYNRVFLALVEFINSPDDRRAFAWNGEFYFIVLGSERT